jgi:hypothetical protein
MKGIEVNDIKFAELNNSDTYNIYVIVEGVSINLYFKKEVALDLQRQINQMLVSKEKTDA